MQVHVVVALDDAVVVVSDDVVATVVVAVVAVVVAAVVVASAAAVVVSPAAVVAAAVVAASVVAASVVCALLHGKLVRKSVNRTMQSSRSICTLILADLSQLITFLGQLYCFYSRECKRAL